MNEEKEHKYVVRSDAWRPQVEEGVHISQGYLSTDADRSVRIRATENEAVLTIKGQNENSRGNGLNRTEFEYDIPLSDAAELLASVCTKPILEKTRYRVRVDGCEWEIDEFEGENRGLVLAEVETDSEAPKVKPDWVGEEVSSDDRFQNTHLVQNPFTAWTGKRDGPEPQFHFKRARAFAKHVRGSLWARSTARSVNSETCQPRPAKKRCTRHVSLSRNLGRLCGL